MLRGVRPLMSTIITSAMFQVPSRSHHQSTTPPEHHTTRAPHHQSTTPPEQ